MDNKCAGDNCKPLQRQADAKAIACTKGQMAHEDIGTDKCKHCPAATHLYTLDTDIPIGLPSLPGQDSMNMPM